jgi:hypothetical protein
LTNGEFGSGPVVVGSFEQGWQRDDARVSKARIFLVGGKGFPSLEEVIALYKRLTGRDLTPDELAKAQERHEAFLAGVSTANPIVCFLSSLDDARFQRIV